MYTKQISRRTFLSLASTAGGLRYWCPVPLPRPLKPEK